MNQIAKWLGIVGCVAIVFVAGLSVPRRSASVQALTRVETAPVVTSWAMNSAEKHALAGLSVRMRLLDQELARVASGDRSLAQEIVQVALALRAIDKANEELVLDARSSRALGVALVQSGSTWVEAPK